MDKKRFRNKYRDLREAISEDEIDQMSLSIANQLLELPIWSGTYYHCFLTITEKKEIDTDYILHILQGRDKSVVVPKANFETSEMQHFLLQENTAIAISDYGIPEPIDGIEVPEKKVDIVFVPLLAYDKNGSRIGYGKGFYDRFLEKCADKCLFIGLSFFPPEEYVEINEKDIQLHYCVTPEITYKFTQKS